MKRVINNRDYSKLRFKGKTYSKGKLVLAVIMHYMNENPRTTSRQLVDKFPRELQNRFNVLETVRKARKISEKTKRFFLNSDQVIKTRDGKKLAVTNYWGSSNINGILKEFRSMGFRISIAQA